jgi:hypothetical protein
MDDTGREQAFINAVATEHFVTQAARSAIVGEMTGRAMLYMGAVSSALIAFGFLAQTQELTPFVAGVVPALLLLGEFTFAALLRNSFENLVLMRHMQRIRAYYRSLVSDSHGVFDAPEGDLVFSAAMATVGTRGHLGQALFTGASTVAAVNAILGAVGAALLLARIGVSVGFAVAVGVPIGIAFFGAHVVYEQRFLAPVSGPEGVSRESN